jgi:hypothetical protein
MFLWSRECSFLGLCLFESVNSSDMPIIAKTGGKSKQSFPAAEDEKNGHP